MDGRRKIVLNQRGNQITVCHVRDHGVVSRGGPQIEVQAPTRHVEAEVEMLTGSLADAAQLMRTRYPDAVIETTGWGAA